MEKFKNFLSSLLDYIYKKKCYFCGSSKECVKMCSKCYNEMYFSDICINRELLGVKVFSAGVYEKKYPKANTWDKVS